MDKNEPFVRNEVDDVTPKKPDGKVLVFSIHGSDETPKQSTQSNQTGQSSLHLQLQESHLSNSTTNNGSSPSVNVTPKPDLSSLSKTTATQEPSASAGLQIRTIEKDRSPSSALPRYGRRLPVFNQLCSGVKFPWYGPQEPDLPSSSGKGTISANSPCAPKVSAEPFTLSPSSPPRQASEQLSCDHQNPGDDVRKV
ncbi:unnamed protein product [Arabidopsis halleri]